jgi:hypothetical protein
MRKLTAFLIAVIVIALPAFPQSKADKEAAKAEQKRVTDLLSAYSDCKFQDGLRIARTDRIQRGGLKYLARETARNITDRELPSGKSLDRYWVDPNGVLNEGVSRTDAIRVMVDYRKPDYFANIRVDRAHSDGYEEDKEILHRWINYMNRERGDSATQSPIEADYNGFKTISSYRSDVDVRKDELGISLIFDDENRIYTTVYFLNQRPKHRIHKSTEEWNQLRERFLHEYTACVNTNLRALQKGS